MKILINISNNLGGGGLQVALSFLQECKKFSEHFYSIAIAEKNCHLLNPNDFPSNFVFHIITYKSLIQISHVMTKIESIEKPDIVFSVFGPTYWTPKSPHIMGFAMGQYLYTDSPFFKTISLKEKILYNIKRRIHLYLIRHEANCIITETEDATERLKKILKTNAIRFQTVSNTCSSYFLSSVNKSVRFNRLPDKQNGEFRFLYLTKYYTHKNIELIPKILEILISKKIYNIKFILTIDSNIYEHIVDNNYTNNIINIGFVSSEDAPSLYSEIDAIIQPSFLEVFSANYVEAMVMKKPIFASDYSFAHTVCGEAAYYFNPLDIHETTEKLLDFVKDEYLRKQLVEHGCIQITHFNTAEQRARQYIDICKSQLID